jgi:hypothetical protein
LWTGLQLGERGVPSWLLKPDGWNAVQLQQARWRCVNAPHLVALVRAGATFVDGFIIEREDQWDAA